MTKVFISASMQDEEIINRIKDALQSIGIEVVPPLYKPKFTGFEDVKKMSIKETHPSYSPEKRYTEEKIKTRILESDIVFLILTPYSLTSDSLANINDEIVIAQNLNKPVYVFVERGTNINVNMKATAYFTFDRINMTELEDRINVVTKHADMIKKEEEKKQALIAAGVVVGIPLFIWLLKNMKKQPI